VHHRLTLTVMFYCSRSKTTVDEKAEQSYDVQPQAGTRTQQQGVTLHYRVTFTSDLLNSGYHQMLAYTAMHSVFTKSDVDSSSGFLLEHGHAHRHTVTNSTDDPIHTLTITLVRNDFSYFYLT